MRTWITAVALLGLAGVSTAQDPLSKREQDYAAALADAAGQAGEFTARRLLFEHGPFGRVETITPERPDEPTPPPRMVNGVSVELDGLTVERLRFETPEQAQEHTDALLNGDLAGQRPLTGELRGNQLVVVHGDAVKDPDMAKRMTEAAWQGLPARDTADAAFTQLEDGTTAATTSLPDGALRASIDKALRSAREHEARAREGVEITTTPTSAQIAFPSGMRARVQSDAQGASVWVARSPEGVEVARNHLTALGGHPAVGTARVMEDMLRRRR